MATEKELRDLLDMALKTLEDIGRNARETEPRSLKDVPFPLQDAHVSWVAGQLARQTADGIRKALSVSED